MQNLVQQIHDMFLRALKEDKKLREVKEKGAKSKKVGGNLFF